jgi:hypothetical protein
MIREFEQVTGRYCRVFSVEARQMLAQDSEAVAHILAPIAAVAAGPTGDGRIDGDPVSNGEAADLLSYLGHNPGAVAAQNVGEFEPEGGPAGHDPEIEVIEGGCFDFQ